MKKSEKKAEIEERKLFVGGPVVVFKWKAGEENIPVEYVSPNVKDVFGYTPEEFTSGKIVYDDIIHPDDRERVIVEAQSYRRKGVMQFEQEYRIVTADGKYKWVHDFTVIKKEKGKPTYYHGYLVDITKRKETEEALGKSEKEYRTLVEKANDGICIVQDGILKYANPRTYEMSGYEVNELIGKKFIQFVIPKEKEKLLQRYKKRISGEKIEEMYETTFLKKDGGRLYAQITVAMVDYEGKPAEIVIIRDITKRKKMEKSLKEERSQLLSIFEGIDEPIYVVDPSTYEILYVNRTMKKEFGSNIIGKKCYETFQKLDKPCDFCTNDKIFGKNFGKTHVWEFHNKKTGKWYRCIDRGITWHDGRKVRLEIAIDITDMVEAEEETKRALELEKQFKLEAAHYFFNPIAIAKGYLELAMEEVPEKQKEKLKAAKHAISRVEKVVKNVTQRGEIRE